MIETLNRLGAVLFHAEGLRDAEDLLRSVDLDLVVCDPEFVQYAPDQFSALLDQAREIAGVPLVVAGEPAAGADGVFTALRDGAADFWSEHFNSDAFIGKLLWMIEKGNADHALRRRYESLRRNQLQTVEIVRATASMFEGLEDDHGDLLEERVEMGLKMIESLANIVHEQITIVDSWFGVQSAGDEQVAATCSGKEIEEQTAAIAEMALSA